MVSKKRLKKLESEDTKYCPKCNKVKPLFEFAFNSKGRKFAQAHCLECQKDKKRESHIKHKYNITLKDYDKILEKQGGKCKICGTKIPGGRGRFHVDHDHKIGKIRGLLCVGCNHMLGNAKDNSETLIAAAHYLINSRK